MLRGKLHPLYPFYSLLTPIIDLRGDGDAAADGACNGTGPRVGCVRAFHRVANVLGNGQVVGNMDTADDEHAVLGFDFTGDPANEVVTFDRDPARCQRACKGAGESAARRRHDIIERRGVRLLPRHIDAVVLGDIAMNAEPHRLGLGGKVRVTEATTNTTNGDFGRVDDLGHDDASGMKAWYG